MPGFVAQISVTGNCLKFPRSLKSMTRLFLHYPGYTRTQVCRDKISEVYLIDPGINHALCGVGTEGELTIAYYGEFFNDEFLNCSSSDTIIAQLIKLFREHGLNIANYLNGSFILLIKNNKSISFINDHYASRPLFYAQKDNVLHVSPELKYFSSLTQYSFAIDETAFIDFLIHGHLLNDKTYFRGVKPLLPGSILVASAHSTTVRRYFDYSFDHERGDFGKFDQDFYMKSLAAKLRKAVEVRVRKSRDLVIPISGGLDSRGILGCVREITDKPIKTVSWGINEDDPESDAFIGRQVAEYLKTDHHFLRRNPYHFSNNVDEMLSLTDGLNDDPVFHHNELNIIKQIRYKLGCHYLMRGDECFGFGDIARSDNEALARVGLYSLNEFDEIKQLIRKDRLEDCIMNSQRELDRILKSTYLEDYTDRKDYFYFHQRLFHYLNPSSYYKMCMIELQNPWLDKQVLEFIMQLPTKYRYRKILFQKTVEWMFPDLCRIPFAKKNSLENWANLLRNNNDIQAKISDAFIMESHKLSSIISGDKVNEFLGHFFDATYHNKTKVKRKIINLGKNYLKKFPLLYQHIKPNAMKHIASREIDSSKIVMRLFLLIRLLKFKELC